MADNIPIRDKNAATVIVRSTDNAGVHTPHHNVDTLPALHLTSLPSQHIDAFSRVRTSDPGYRFDAQFTNQIDSDLWDSLVTDDGVTGDANDGTITHDATNRMVVLTAKAGAEGVRTCVLQSHYHSPYTSGRGQLAIVTGIPDATLPVAGGEIGMGYFDGFNGAYIRCDSTGIYVGIKTTTDAPDDEVEQTLWNVDTLGAGALNPSGITLDPSKGCILVVPIQALYLGRVTFAMDIGGDIIPIHTFDHANEIDVPYIAQASLPVRYWATANNTAADVVIKAVCCSVISEGGEALQDISGRPFASRGTNTDVDAAAEAILVVRAKAQLNGINQNAVVIPTDLNVSVASSGCWIEVRRNVTVTAGDFTDVNARSVCEECFCGNVGADPVVTAGTGDLIDVFYVPATATVRGSSTTGLTGKVVLAYSHLLATADNIAIIALEGTNSEVRASLKWKEIR